MSASGFRPVITPMAQVGHIQTGSCASGLGDPVALYDEAADRWLLSEFASSGNRLCVYISQTSDPSGAYWRYDFPTPNFPDYPKYAVWPDAYYMSMNVFNSAGTASLGPQPFAFNRSAMLSGSSATFITPGITGGNTEETYLPADLDGSTLPPAGAPNTFVEWPNGGFYKVFHFHVDFATPANSTFTLFRSVPAAGFTQLCAEFNKRLHEIRPHFTKESADHHIQLVQFGELLSLIQ